MRSVSAVVTISMNARWRSFSSASMLSSRSSLLMTGSGGSCTLGLR